MNHRLKSDAGAGVFSMAFGIAMFLAFLLFAVQLITHLYATSVVTSAAYSAAQQAATHGHPPTPEEREAARRHGLEVLGEFGDDVEFTWLETGRTDVVKLHLHVSTPRLLPDTLVGATGLDEVNRTVEVRIEKPVE